MAKRYKYAGILAKKREPIILFPNDHQIEAAFRIIYEAHTVALIHELFADCNAGRFNAKLEKGLAAGQTGWRKVAMTLAERHVAGFEPKQSRDGRPARTDEADIWVAVTQRMAKGQSLRQAARGVLKDRGQKDSVAAIESAFRRYVKRHSILKRQKSK